MGVLKTAVCKMGVLIMGVLIMGVLKTAVCKMGVLIMGVLIMGVLFILLSLLLGLFYGNYTHLYM